LRRRRIQVLRGPASRAGGGIAHGALSPPGAGGQSLDGDPRLGRALSIGSRHLPRALRGARADTPDTASPPLHRGRLQLPPPGPLRRARLPLPGDVRAEPGRRRLYGRRDPARRAAATRAVAGRGDRPRTRRGDRLSQPRATRSRRAGLVSRHGPPRREPYPIGRASEPRYHLSRCRVTRECYAALGVSVSLLHEVARSDDMRLHVRLATPTSVRPARTVALSATYPAITDIETAVPTTHESSRRPSPPASRAFIRPSEKY